MDAEYPVQVLEHEHCRGQWSVNGHYRSPWRQKQLS